MAVMRAYLNRQITRLWVWMVTFDIHRDASPCYRLQPGDEERLIGALVDMNAAMVRAARF